MEKLEIVIAVLLLCLVALGVYVTTYWTLSRKKRRDAEDDPKKTEVQYRHLDERAENERKKVATAYAQETMPRITITPVQPRPNFPRVCSILLSDRDSLHSTTRTITSKRIGAKVISAYSKKKNTPESFILLFSPEKFARFFLLKEFNPSLISKW